MTENKFERLGRVKHPVLGDCVKVKLRSWIGPVYAGDKGKEIWTDYLFPRDQFRFSLHPRHPSGFDLDGLKVTGCFSPSLSYFSELCKYANFRWAKPNDSDTT